MKRIALLFLAFCFSKTMALGFTSVTVGFDQAIEAPRWLYDANLKIKSTPLTLNMVEIKKAQNLKERTRCLNAINQALPRAKSLGAWLSLNELKCAQLPDKKGEFSKAALLQALARVEREQRWLSLGPASEMLREQYTRSVLLLAEVQVKSDRLAAWKTLDKLQQLKSWLPAQDRASLWRWAGEMAFVDQNLPAAHEFFNRSLKEKENPELRTRIESIRTTLMGKKKPEPTAPSLPVGSEDLGMSDDEKALVGRMNRAYESQDFVTAIEDGVELIRKFPGSRRSNEAADRVLEIYLSVAGKTDEKFRHVRESVVKLMAKVDAGRMSRFATQAYLRGNYADALKLAEACYLAFAGHPDSTRMLLLAGKAAYASGEYADAYRFFGQLVRLHSGTAEAADATFRLGLLEFRQQRYPQAAGFFERVLALSAGRDFQYRALYWQWRAQQKMDFAKSAPFAKPLIEIFPLSYYGLRALAETSGEPLQLKTQASNNRVELRLFDSDRQGWERISILLKSGWLSEAEAELESLPPPGGPEEQVIRAKYLAAVLRYDLATQTLNKAFEVHPEWQTVGLLKTIFPLEFTAAIQKEAKANNVAENWVRSLIRQESSFRPEAKSTSNALGVMQLIPPTAQEVAADLKMKDLKIPDSLFDPSTNIRMGTYYLARMIRDFKGSIPLALAAYNAGPTRLRRWLSSRPDLVGLDGQASSAPEVELWIDELPWEETSLYVKAILRNRIIYQMLDGSKVKLTEPIWMDADKVAR